MNYPTVHIKLFLALALFVSPTISLVAQELSSLETALDAIISEYNQADAPGGAVAVVRGENVVYTRAFGLAHLDHQIKADLQTPFFVGDICNQFIAMSALLLVDRGEVELDAPITKYLPELPNYAQAITLRHLLTHTHHLAGSPALLTLAGWGMEGHYDADAILSLLRKQTALKQEPGSSYAYNGVGFQLAAEIVERMSGQSFESFIRSELFEPLGMTNSHFPTLDNQLIPQQAPIYSGRDGNYAYDPVEYFFTTTDTYYSTITDMAKWAIHLHKQRLINSTTLAELDRRIDLVDGNEESWPAMGQYAGRYRGLYCLQKYGLAYGQLSNLTRFPEQGVTIIVMSNLTNFRASLLGEQLADVVLKDDFTATEEEAPPVTRSEPIYVQWSAAKKEAFVGHYWEVDELYSREIALRNDTLRYVRNPGSEQILLPIDDEHLRMVIPGNDIIFSLAGDTLITDVNASFIYHLRPYQPMKASTTAFEKYTGSYYCEALQVVYKVAQEDEQLLISHPNIGQIRLSPFEENQFYTDHYYMGLIHFEENGKSVNSFRLESTDIVDLTFVKIE